MSTTGQARHFGEYGLFERPVDARNPPATRCSAQAVGDRYNPAGKPPCTYSNRADCELGDLTGKFGFFPQSRVASQFFDNNLPLGGTNSIVGRSVVLSDSDGARWICATIAPMTDANVNAAGQNCSQLAAMGSCAVKVFTTAALIAGIGRDNVSALLPTSCPTLQGADGAGSAADLTPAPLPTDDPSLADAPATTLVLTMAGTLSDFTPAKLASVKTSLASAAGISESLIDINIKSGSVVLEATMPSSGATIVMSQIQSGALKQLGGATVESVAISTTALSLEATDAPVPVSATAVPVDTMTTSPVSQASAAPSSEPPSRVPSTAMPPSRAPSTAMPSGAAALIGAPAKAATSNVPARYDGCLPRDPGAMFRPPCIAYALRLATHAVSDMCRAAPATVLTLAALAAAALLVS